jgi:hypothetical protein
MTVYQIIMQVIVSSIILKALDEIREVGIYGQLMYLPVFTRPEMNEAGVLPQFIDYFIHRIVDPGINVNLMPQSAQLARQFQNIDAHTAGVSGAQPAYRAAMSAKHGNLEWLFVVQNILPGPSIQSLSGSHTV